MATLPDRPNTALLVIDVQVGVVRSAHAREAVVAAVGAAVERARAAGVAVIWVQHDANDLPLGSEDWRLAPELVSAESDPLIGKRYGDAFEGTRLEAVLAGLRVGRLIVAGAETDACIRSTLHGAFARGYDVTLLADAHTTNDRTSYGAPSPEQVIAHTNLYWRFQAAPGRTAEVATSKDVEFGHSGGAQAR